MYSHHHHLLWHNWQMLWKNWDRKIETLNVIKLACYLLPLKLSKNFSRKMFEDNFIKNKKKQKLMTEEAYQSMSKRAASIQTKLSSVSLCVFELCCWQMEIFLYHCDSKQHPENRKAAIFCSESTILFYLSYNRELRMEDTTSGCYFKIVIIG